jgi:hypothetical protein
MQNPRINPDFTFTALALSQICHVLRLHSTRWPIISGFTVGKVADEEATQWVQSKPNALTTLFV